MIAGLVTPSDKSTKETDPVPERFTSYFKPWMDKPKQRIIPSVTPPSEHSGTVSQEIIHFSIIILFSPVHNELFSLGFWIPTRCTIRSIISELSQPSATRIQRQAGRQRAYETDCPCWNVVPDSAFTGFQTSAL